jgi:hypothetical protein
MKKLGFFVMAAAIATTSLCMAECGGCKRRPARQAPKVEDAGIVMQKVDCPCKKRMRPVNPAGQPTTPVS